MRYLIILLVLLNLSLAGCERQQPGGSLAVESEPARPLIVASNYPLYYFASRIAGDSAEIVLPEIEGDPANWRPGAAAIGQLQSASLILLVGAGYESWLQWVSVPDDRLLDTSAGFHDRLIPLEQETVHQHGPGGEHSHEGMAFTVWLDPDLAIEQAKAIEQALAALFPDNAAVCGERLASLTTELKDLDSQLEQVFNSIGDQPLLFSHPVYQYLERKYGLNGHSVHWEPEESTGNSAVVELHNVLRRHPAKLMIWEAQPLESTVNELENLGVASLPFDTASNLPAESNYFDVMAGNIQRLSLHDKD